MKTNLKSGNFLVRLLLSHGEKLGMLGIAICTAMIVWSAMGLERLGPDKEPGDLESLVSRARTNIDSKTWDDIPDEDKLEAKPIETKTMKPVLKDHFPPIAKLDPLVFEPVSARLDPDLLTPEDLEVHGDSGLWLSADPDVIRDKTLEAIKEQERLQKKEDDARERDERAGKDERQGGGGLYGAEGSEYGRGLARDEKTRKGKDDTIVQQPRTGARLQGFEDVTARSWVTIVARVPIENQYNLYSESLRTAKGYNESTDIPSYVGYQVQRVDVKGKGEPEWGKTMTTVSGKTVREDLETYPVEVADVIDPRVKHPILTHPLPPLILREWDDRVSHSSMPLASEIEPEGYNDLDIEDETPGDAQGEEDIFAGPVGMREGPGSRGLRGPGMAGGRGRYGGMEGGFGGMGGEFGGMGGMGGEYGAMGGMGGEYGAMGGMGGEYGAMGGMGGGYGGGIGRLGRGRGAQLDAFTWDGKTSSVLLRYFDNSVESGRRYRYRVRLVLRDVHNMVPVKHLDKSVIDRRESKKNKKGEGPLYRFSEWSEPSPIASVPLPARLYVVGSTPAKETNFYDEPEAEVLIKSLNSEFASEVAATEEFTRGSVVNIEKKAAVIWTSSTTKQEYPEFLFRTGITVLGFTGGEKFSKNRNLLAPTRALLMDPAGRLFVQSELKDQETLEEFQAILEKDQDGRGRNPYGRGGYEGEATGPQGFGGFGGEF